MKASISYGTGIEKIDEYDIKHLCNTVNGSSGWPILSCATNKVIGIHKKFVKKGFNAGTFLKFPLNELNQNYIKVKEKESKIKDIKNINNLDTKKIVIIYQILSLTKLQILIILKNLMLKLLSNPLWMNQNQIILKLKKKNLK